MQKLDCGHAESSHGEFTRGYGVDNDGLKWCYACCAKRDRYDMDTSGEWTGYYCTNEGRGTITNWPGSLSIPVTRVKHSHGFGFGGRYQITTGNFVAGGFVWSFRNAGDSQIAHCKRTKQAV